MMAGHLSSQKYKESSDLVRLEETNGKFLRQKERFLLIVLKGLLVKVLY